MSSSLPIALQQVAQLLKTDDDLDKIAHLKEQLSKEKSLIEIELNSKSQAEMEQLLNNFQNLQLSANDLKKLRKFILEINSLAEASFRSIDSYESINRLTKIHEIFEIVTHIVNKISNFEPALQEIDELIEEEDYQNIDIDSRVDNLLLIHYKLNEALNFKDLANELSHFSNDDSKFVIKKLLKKVEPIINKFNVMLSNIINGLVESCKIGNDSLIVRLIKIIDFEEQQDLKIEFERSAVSKSSNGTEKVDNEALLFEQIINGNLINSRIFERGYKDFFIKEAEKSVNETFENCWETFNQGDAVELFKILDNLQWVFQDLKCVQLDLVKLAPKNPRWDLFRMFYDIYYKQLNIIINRLIESEPETFFILEIIDFDSNFKEIMMEEFNMKSVKTIIGEDEKAQLLDDYLNMVINTNKGWMSNLIKTEQETFRKRITAPEQDVENLYALEGSKIVFQMFTQQCDVSLGTKQGKILDGVINKFIDLLIERQKLWGQLIQSEVSKLIQQNHKERSKSKKKDDEENEKEEEPVPPGLIEYLIALGNDQMRGADYTEAISNKYCPMVSKKYQTSINEGLEKGIDGFADLGKQCCDALIVIMFDDLNYVFKNVFEKSWLKNSNENIIQMISDTIFEYLAEFKENMNQYLFEILSEETMDECILQYFKNLKKDTSIFKEKNETKILDLINNDYQIFKNLFDNFLVDKDTIEHKFQLFEEVIDFLSIRGETIEDEDMMINIWAHIIEQYNDIPLEFFESLVKFKGFSKNQVRRVTNKAETRQRNILQLEIPSSEIETTFMSRF